MEKKAIIFDIARSSFVDGPGIRTTVFFKGCNLRCAWCHNPESWKAETELMFYRDKCTACGACLRNCPNDLKSCDFCGRCEHYCPNDARRICGKEYTAKEIFDEVARDKIFYDTSGGGATFSGGECMLYPDFLCDVLALCKDNGIHTAVDTAGNVPWESFLKVLPYTDLFLYDIKLMDSDLHKKYTGVSNELILQNLAKLLNCGANVFIRVPIIAGINDSASEMQKIKAFFDEHGCPQKIELLPYHKLGESKAHAIGKEPVLFDAPGKEKMDELNKIFEDM